MTAEGVSEMAIALVKRSAVYSEWICYTDRDTDRKIRITLNTL